MQKQFLIVRESDQFIYGVQMQDDPDAGPIIPQGDSPIGGARLVEFSGEFTRNGRRDTEVAYWRDGEQVWVEMAPLAALVDRAISAIDSAADAARSEVISRQTNTLEYQRVEMQARSFRSAGYPDTDVPSGVASWASAKYRDGWTARQAADDIIATADAWYGLLDGIRDLRLHAKEDVRHAADGSEIAVRVSAFKNDLSNLMKGPV